MRKLLLVLVGVFVGNAMMNNYLHKRDINELVEVRNKLSEENQLSATESLGEEKPKRSLSSIQNPVRVKAKVLDGRDNVEEELAQYFGEETVENTVALKPAKREAEIQSESLKLQKKLIQ